MTLTERLTAARWPEWIKKLAARWDKWDELKYLSPSERRLNRWLWRLLGIALAFALAHHIWLVHVPSPFSWGPAFGVVCYELAIAYTGAFIFYGLIVRVPLRRDRHNIYEHLAPLLSRIVGAATGLMMSLNRTADVTYLRKNMEENVEDTCSKIGPQTEAALLVPVPPDGMRKGNVMDDLHERVTDARKLHAQLLSFSQYLASDLIKFVAAADNCKLFKQVEKHYGYVLSGVSLDSPNLSYLSEDLLEYLRLADQIDNYRVDNKIPGYELPAGMTYVTVLRSDDDPPLFRHMNLD